jgi:protein-S-isoprenylcysteine O-methyltransferase Ste14
MALLEEFESQGNFLFKHRTWLPFFTLLIGLGVYIYHHLRGTHLDLGTGYFISAFTIGLFGQLIRVFTVGYTPENTSGRNTSGQLADQLNTTGIYSLVRHPLYLGNFFMWLGVAMLTSNTSYLIFFILSYWLYYERIMYAEEAFLRNKFGETFLSWAGNVPAFIPKFSGYKKPKFPFSVFKVLKKEKNGYAALFGLFYLFETIGVLIKNGVDGFHFTWLFYCFILSLLLYFILKFLKSNHYLDEVGR